MKENNLVDRLFDFSVNVIKFLRTIENNGETRILKYQLTKSSSSSGANYEEAQGAISKPDFNSKVSIALKEMRESNYWLRLLYALEHGDKNICKLYVQESFELKNILGAIYSKVSKSISQKKQ